MALLRFESGRESGGVVWRVVYAFGSGRKWSKVVWRGVARVGKWGKSTREWSKVGNIYPARVVETQCESGEVGNSYTFRRTG